MFRFKCSLSLIVASVLTCIGPDLLRAEEENEFKTTYRVMYRIGTKGEWHEAAEAGSPAKSKDGADQIAKRLQQRFGGGLATVETEIRKTPEQEASGPRYSLEDTVWRMGNANDNTELHIMKNGSVKRVLRVLRYDPIEENGQWTYKDGTLTVRINEGKDSSPYPYKVSHTWSFMVDSRGIGMIESYTVKNGIKRYYGGDPGPHFNVFKLHAGRFAKVE